MNHPLSTGEARRPCGRQAAWLAGHAICELTGQLDRGHAPKHVAAAPVVLSMVAARKPGPRRHNEAHRLPQGA